MPCPAITKPPLLQRSRLTGGGSPNLVGLVERKALYREKWELQIVAIDIIHDCTLVLYKQLIQTGFSCYPSHFTLSWAFLSTPCILQENLCSAFWQQESPAVRSLDLLMSRPAKSPGRSCPTPSNRDEMN